MFNALFDALEVRPVISNVASISNGINALSYGIDNITTNGRQTIENIIQIAQTFKALQTSINAEIVKHPSCCGEIQVSYELIWHAY